MRGTLGTRGTQGTLGELPEGSSPRPPQGLSSIILLKGKVFGITERNCFPKVEPAPYRFSRRGAGGGSPRRNKQKISPFPTGEGGWGDRGQKRKLKGGLAGDQPGTPPAGHRDAPSPRSVRGTPPRRARGSPPSPVPRPAQPRGCKGRSPLHEITLVSPFPTGEGGRGDRGKKVKQRQGRQATNRARPPPGAWFAPFPSAARVNPRGCKGRSPLHKIT